MTEFLPVSSSAHLVLYNKFVIGCLDKSIKITKLKKEGKKSMSSTEFLKGFDLKIGKMLE